MAIEKITNFSGMMNLVTTDELMQKNEVRMAVNANPDFIGGIQKDLGYTQEGGTVEAAEDPRAGHGYYEPDGTRHHLVVYDQDIYEDVAGTWTSRTTVLTQDIPGTFETFLGRVYYVNGVDPSKSSSDATTWSTTANITNMPRGKYIKKAGGLLYVANHIDEYGLSGQDLKVWFCNEPDRESIVWNRERQTDLAQTATSATVTSAAALFKTNGIRSGDTFQITTGSNAGTYTVLTVDSETQITLTEALTNTQAGSWYVAGSNWFEARDGIGGEITGLGENNNRLLIFKEGALLRWDETSLTTVSATIGTSSHNSIQTIDRMTFFFNANGSNPGVYMYDGRSPILISRKIEPLLRDMAASNYANVWSMADSQRYYLWIGNVAAGDRHGALTNAMVIYDRYQKTWEVRDDIQGKLGWSFIDSTGAFDLYMGNTAEVMKFNSGTNNDSRPIHMQIESQQYDQNAAWKYKKYTNVWVNSEEGEGAELLYRVGLGTHATEYKPLAQLNNLLTKGSLNTIGTWIQFKINASGTQSGPKIKAVHIEYETDRDYV